MKATMLLLTTFLMSSAYAGTVSSPAADIVKRLDAENNRSAYCDYEISRSGMPPVSRRFRPFRSEILAAERYLRQVQEPMVVVMHCSIISKDPVGKDEVCEQVYQRNADGSYNAQNAPDRKSDCWNDG